MSTEPHHPLNGTARKLALAGLALISIVAIVGATIIEVVVGPAPAAMYVLAAGAAGGLSGVLSPRG